MISEASAKPAQNSVFDHSYEMLEAIGRGRNSVVYRARKLSGDRSVVALKVLVGSAKNPAANERRMRREALGMLASRSPHVVRLLDFVATDALCYLAMEYAAGGDLRALLQQEGKPLSLELTLRVARDVLAGLKAVHRAGIVHRDIKPENLLLASNEAVKIADFGIAYLPTEQLSLEEAQVGVGTFDYLAPEALEAGVHDERTDLYSLGVTCYQLLTGELPFAGSSFSEQVRSKMEGTYKPLRQFSADTPRGLEQLLARALASNPDKRFRTAADLERAVDAVAAGEGLPETDAGFSLRTDHRSDLPNLFAEDAEDAEETPAPADLSEAGDDDLSFEPERPRYRRVVAGVLVAAVVATAGWSAARSYKELALRKGAKAPPAAQPAPEAKAAIKAPVDAQAKSPDEPLPQILAADHRGVIKGLLSDDEDIAFSTVRLQGTAIAAIGIPGWELAPLERGRSDASYRIQGSGFKLTLHIDETSPTELSGSYREEVSGRKGSWVLAKR